MLTREQWGQEQGRTGASGRCAHRQQHPQGAGRGLRSFVARGTQPRASSICDNVLEIRSEAALHKEGGCSACSQDKGCSCSGWNGWREDWALVLTLAACSSHYLLNQLLELKRELVVLGRSMCKQQRRDKNDPSVQTKHSCTVTSQVYRDVEAAEGSSRYLGLLAQEPKHVFVYLVLGNLPNYAKKDNGLKFPVPGFTGAHFLKARSLCRIFPSKHTFAEWIFNSSPCPLIPHSSDSIHNCARCHGFASFPCKFDLAKNKAKRLSGTPEVSVFSTLTCPEILL